MVQEETTKEGKNNLFWEYAFLRVHDFFTTQIKTCKDNNI